MAELDDSFFYEHSGKPGLSVPLILAIGLPISAILAIIYVYVVVYCPVIGYVNFLFLAGYVLGTGFVLAWLAKIGKCRSPKLLFVLGFVAGLVGLYFSWTFFFVALGYPLDMMLNPATLWKNIVNTNAQGWWGPSGIVQWILCAIEALGFTFGVGVISSGSLDREVFCEDCNAWCEATHTRHLKITDEFAARMEADEDEDINHLEVLRLPEATADELPRFDADVLECPTCDTSALRLSFLNPTEDKNGEVEVESADLPGILLQRGKGAK